jgi:hypothetical protein
MVLQQAAAGCHRHQDRDPNQRRVQIEPAAREPHHRPPALQIVHRPSDQVLLRRQATVDRHEQREADQKPDRHLAVDGDAAEQRMAGQPASAPTARNVRRPIGERVVCSYFERGGRAHLRWRAAKHSPCHRARRSHHHADQRRLLLQQQRCC